MRLPNSHRDFQKIVTAGLLAVTFAQHLFPEEPVVQFAALLINIVWVWT